MFEAVSGYISKKYPDFMVYFDPYTCSCACSIAFLIFLLFLLSKIPLFPPLPQHHLRTIDPESVLGLSEDSIQCYSIGEQRRQVGNALLPPITPYQAVSANNEIKILMKGNHCQLYSLSILTNL